jgi:hypothetical protein
MAKRRPPTEVEWLSARYPTCLLDYLRRLKRITNVPGGRRRIRLFCCACCRQIWHMLKDERSRRAVEVSERFADGLATRRELTEATEAAFAVDRELSHVMYKLMAPTDPELVEEMGESIFDSLKTADGRWLYYERMAASTAAWAAKQWSPGHSASYIPEGVAYLVIREAEANKQGTGLAAREALEQRQCQVLRDIFGNPVRPTPGVDPTWLAWNGSAVMKIVLAICQEGRFGDLPILGDALEDAGFSDAEILGHCRSSEEHVRGCWVVDLLLGKK